MSKVTGALLIGLVILATSVWADGIGQLHNLGYVVVSPGGPDDGGDFGPNTPGTLTSGIQEAFNYARDNTKEVYIIGGPAKDVNTVPVTYNLDTTLTIPWGQDWHCDGGEYVMNFTITNGDCLVIDSQMSCFLKFGSIVAESLESGSIVRIHPTTVGPDGFNVVGVTMFQFGSIVGGCDGPSNPGKGVGLHLDATTLPNGNLSDNTVFVKEIVGCETGIFIEGSRGVIHNTIECQSMRRCNNFIQVSEGWFNNITTSMSPNNVGGTVVGAQLSGGNENIYNLTWQGIFDPGSALVFGSTAQDNIVYAMGLPTNGITNNAGNPTNRIVPTKPVGFNVATPPVPASNIYVVNRESYSVIATMLTAGSVSSWTLKDSSGITQTITSALLAGQTFYLEPGDSIKFAYDPGGAPTWVWRALR